MDDGRSLEGGGGGGAGAGGGGGPSEIAEGMGQVLREAGLSADVVAVESVTDLAPYQAFVLGSAVYVGQWQKEAASFLEQFEEQLAQRPVWLFSSGAPR